MSKESLVIISNKYIPIYPIHQDFSNEFADRINRSIDQAPWKWSKDLRSKVPSKAYFQSKAPAYGNIIDLLLLAEV